jgi:hypothetical protein
MLYATAALAPRRARTAGEDSATAPGVGFLLARTGARLRTGAPRSRRCRPSRGTTPPGPEAPNNVDEVGIRLAAEELETKVRGGNGRAPDCPTFPPTVLENKHKNKHSTPRVKTGKLKGVLHLLEWRNWQTHGTQNPATFTGHEGSTPSSSTN